MQQQIEEEIEDEIILADEQYQQEKEAHTQIVRNRKLQSIRKVGLMYIYIYFAFIYQFSFFCFNRKKQENVWIKSEMLQ